VAAEAARAWREALSRYGCECSIVLAVSPVIVCCLGDLGSIDSRHLLLERKVEKSDSPEGAKQGA
jgi:hypothetical protein